MSYFFTNEEINQEIKLSLEEALQNGEGTKYGYFIINKGNINDVQIINNHPDWFDVYLKNHHQLSDPVVKSCLFRIEGFCWDEKITGSTQPGSSQSLRESEMMHEARGYNIINGQTAIIHDYQNNLALFSIYNLSSELRGKRNTPNMERQLYLFNRLHQRLLCCYRDINRPVDFHLTRREKDILYFSSIGKTYKEIAILTNITEYTIKFHMAKIVNKLNAENTRHAIKIASDLQLIHAR